MVTADDAAAAACAAATEGVGERGDSEERAPFLEVTHVDTELLGELNELQAPLKLEAVRRHRCFF
jgi:hypothetical protein